MIGLLVIFTINEWLEGVCLVLIPDLHDHADYRRKGPSVIGLWDKSDHYNFSKNRSMKQRNNSDCSARISQFIVTLR